MSPREVIGITRCRGVVFRAPTRCSHVSSEFCNVVASWAGLRTLAHYTTIAAGSETTQALGSETTQPRRYNTSLLISARYVADGTAATSKVLRAGGLRRRCHLRDNLMCCVGRV